MKVLNPVCSQVKKIMEKCSNKSVPQNMKNEDQRESVIVHDVEKKKSNIIISIGNGQIPNDYFGFVYFFFTFCVGKCKIKKF